MTEQDKPKATRCTAERETLRLGRWVADYERCKNRTRHPSGKCHVHRSDYEDDGPRDA